MCLFVSSFKFHLKLACASRQEKPMGGLQSTQPHHHHTITSTAESRHPHITGQSSQEPDWRRCVAHAGWHKHLCFFSEKLGERARGNGRRRGLVWCFIRCRVVGNHTKHKRWRLFSRPDCVIHSGIWNTVCHACNICLRRTETEGPLVCCARSDVSSRHPTRTHRLLCLHYHQQRDGRTSLADALASKRTLLSGQVVLLRPRRTLI